MSLAILEPELKTNAPERSVPSIKEQTDWVAVARDLAKTFRPTAVDRERRNELPVEPLKQIRESGLVNLLIPKKFGGLGRPWKEAAHVVIELSKADGSIGALLGYHYINSSIPRQFDYTGDAEKIERKSAANHWLWGNISQPWEKNFRADPLPGGRFLLNGVKAWNTGPSLADVTTVLAPRSDREEFLYAYIPTDRPGLTYHKDWDHLGLRLTDTVTITFENVEIEADEVIPSTLGAPQRSFPPFYFLGTPIFASYYIGAALGALETAREYTLTKSRPFPGSGVDSAAKDPFILREYGDWWIQTQAALALLEKFLDEAQAAWERRRSISPEELGDVATKAAAVRAFAGKVSLEVTPKIYDVTGARASANHYGFDRFWRDVRIHTLHDPLVHSVKAIGNFVLSGQPALIPPFYF